MVVDKLNLDLTLTDWMQFLGRKAKTASICSLLYSMRQCLHSLPTAWLLFIGLVDANSKKHIFLPFTLTAGNLYNPAWKKHEANIRDGGKPLTISLNVSVQNPSIERGGGGTNIPPPHTVDQCSGSGSICFLGLPDPDLLVRVIDPDPSIIKQNSKKKIDS